MTEEYLILFRAVADAIDDLEALRSALIKAEQRAEETYLSAE